MPGRFRPNKKMMEIAYAILKTPKNMQQRNEPQPSDSRKREWAVDTAILR